jgi:RNA polymerase sigma factor (TIGR02999 family)
MAGDERTPVDAGGDGDAVAIKALFARVYEELKPLARKQLAASGGHTLNTTGLIHEAYLKLARGDERPLHNRVHFFALAAKAMRQIVIDHARARIADKRGGADLHIVALDEAADVAGPELSADDLLRLDRALAQLESDDPRLARLVELRFFTGLSIHEIALLQATSERTLNRDWRLAKAHLYATLHPET